MFVSAGCNRLPNCVHWGSNNLIAFGTYNCVFIYNFNKQNGAGSIIDVLKGHKGKVHCIKWIESPSHYKENINTLEIVSGAADNNIIIWRRDNTKFKLHTVLRGHAGSVTATDGMYIVNSESGNQDKLHTLLASASIDSTVKIWERRESTDEFDLVQTISFGNGFALDVALGLLSGGNVPILAIGGDDGKVHLYVRKGKEMIKVQQLVGHEDWVRGLEFAVDDNGDLLLASCSQDCFIRLWRITKDTDTEDAARDIIKLKRNIFAVENNDVDEKFAVNLDSLLAGHEQWIYGIHWQPSILSETDGSRHQPMCLLSASMDKTMIVWKLDSESGIWLDQVRVGEVGGNTLGLYGCQFSPDGHTILAHGYHGAFHAWTSTSEDTSLENYKWEPSVTISGHFGSIEDIAWDPEGAFILSVSADQTTRLFAPWKRKGCKTTWHEIARPQVHGYDMQCLAMIGRFKFISGADEKVLRVFQAPVNFMDNFQQISNEVIDHNTLEQTRKQIPEGASVPALGLSNKAVYSGETGVTPTDREIVHPSDQYTDIFFAPVALKVPPTEEHLLQNTLWPETQKLYGHGFEIFSVASHPLGTLIASSCKAAKAEHAGIILWDTGTWRQIGHLLFHNLTVTQLAFSHNGKYLLSVSRDRTWCLFAENCEDNDILYNKVAHTDKKSALHSRIIWACSWSHDDKYFATASRDKKVIVWGRKEDCKSDSGCLGNYGACSVPLDVGVSTTAIDFAPCNGRCNNDCYILAVGLESGELSIYKWNRTTTQIWSKCSPVLLGHTLAIKRLRWRPVVNKNVESSDESQDDNLELASCSADCSLILHSVNFSKI